ncbi:MAG: CoA ester lyase [Sphingopyxis sp.]|nr:CoA ester lyase [Sphingopyxis sp.]
MTLAIQSMLFVPGTKPDRFAKALASGADCVCIDLEDAVPAGEKDAARAAALDAIKALDDPRLAIRINGMMTRAGLADALALAAAAMRAALVFVQMVESPVELAQLRSVLADGAVRFVPLIETVAGLRAADAIAADPSTAMLMFGGGDFSAQLGVPLAWEPLALARAQLVMAAAGAGKPALDVPFIHMDDPAGLAAECRRAKELGFAAKAAIHPAQIAVIHDIFRPKAADIAEAESALAAFAAGGYRPIRHNGKMLEAPVVRRFEQILALKDRIDA